MQEKNGKTSPLSSIAFFVKSDRFSEKEVQIIFPVNCSQVQVKSQKKTSFTQIIIINKFKKLTLDFC